MSSRTEVDYRGYRIVAARLKGQPAARVFRKTMMVRKDPFEGRSLEKATEAAKVWVDQFQADMIRQRRAPNVGTIEEYVRYFSLNPLAKHEQRMLTAHAAAPDHTMSAGELAVAAGWDDYSSANLHYGKLGSAVAQDLELTLPKHSDGKDIGTSALADSAGPDWTPVDGLFRWQMHPELVEALQRLNIR